MSNKQQEEEGEMRYDLNLNVNQDSKAVANAEIATAPIVAN